MPSDQTQPDQRQPDQKETSDQQQPPVLSFKEFLEKVPPVTASVVQGISHKEQSRGGGDSYYLDLPPTLSCTVRPRFIVPVFACLRPYMRTSAAFCHLVHGRIYSPDINVAIARRPSKCMLWRSFVRSPPHMGSPCLERSTNMVNAPRSGRRLLRACSEFWDQWRRITILRAVEQKSRGWELGLSPTIGGQSKIRKIHFLTKSFGLRSRLAHRRKYYLTWRPRRNRRSLVVRWMPSNMAFPLRCS